MDIPPEVEIPITIGRGSVYLYRHEAKNKDGTTYSGDRFFVVLNTTPKNDDDLFLVTLTTKIEARRKYIKNIGEDPDTLVVIPKSEFNPLSKRSAVNCNEIHVISMQELIDKVNNSGKIFSEEMPKRIVASIVAGVLKSSQVPGEIKKQLV